MCNTLLPMLPPVCHHLNLSFRHSPVRASTSWQGSCRPLLHRAVLDERPGQVLQSPRALLSLALLKTVLPLCDVQGSACMSRQGWTLFRGAESRTWSCCPRLQASWWPQLTAASCFFGGRSGLPAALPSLRNLEHAGLVQGPLPSRHLSPDAL